MSTAVTLQCVRWRFWGVAEHSGTEVANLEWCVSGSIRSMNARRAASRERAGGGLRQTWTENPTF